MSWLVGVIMLAGLAHGQPPPITVSITGPSTAIACAPTELTVTVDNRGHPARDVSLALEVSQRDNRFPVWVFDEEFQLPSGQWQRLNPNQLHLPADARHEYRLRARFAVGRHTVQVHVVEAVPDQFAKRVALASATAEINVTGPLIRIQRPVRDRVTTAELTEFAVAVRGHDGAPPVAFEIRSDTRPDKYRRADGVTVEVATDPGQWRPVELFADHGWYGTVDLGGLPTAEERSMWVRFRMANDTGSMPLQVRLVNGLCVAAADGFDVKQVAAKSAPTPIPAPAPAPKPPGALMFGLGVMIGAVATLPVLLVWSRVRKR